MSIKKKKQHMILCPLKFTVDSEVRDIVGATGEYLGLAKKFVWVFHNVMEKPERTFWPTQ